MPLSVGIVGLPNAGKSTLFRALTRASVAIAPYPFTTVDPNVGVLAVSDDRLPAIAAVVDVTRQVPATVRVADIAGLVRNAHRGEGLGAQFLGHIRDVSAIVHVVRAFEDVDVVHVEGAPDPARDVEIVETELALADLEAIERRREKIQPQARVGDAAARDELASLTALAAHVGAGRPVRAAAAHLRASARPLRLLTDKPVLYVVNEDENAANEGERRLRERVGPSATVLSVSLRIEAELLDLAPADAAAYRAAAALEVEILAKIAHAAYKLLDQITFFTTESRECRAWPIARGTAAVDAAGDIHSDMRDHFVRAEVVSTRDLLSTGSWAAARDRGRVRLEGRAYEVRDGDVITFRFGS
ncbi:MAG: redox-regulated ATPase YchF [Armatimonadetes bacterium]|nr:redox-regulated ATPase YchF [Armatimonadota bacterium]